MKKILIIKKELHEYEGNVKVLIKKNKTICKDYTLMNELKEKYINYKPQYFLEEWEIWNDEKLQICFANDGSPLRPIHIICDSSIKRGPKALFQTEKIIVMKISKGVFEITKYQIDENGIIKRNLIQIGNYNMYIDIEGKINEQFKNVIEVIIDKYNNYYKNGYLSPFYYIF